MIASFAVVCGDDPGGELLGFVQAQDWSEAEAEAEIMVAERGCDREADWPGHTVFACSSVRADRSAWFTQDEQHRRPLVSRGPLPIGHGYFIDVRHRSKADGYYAAVRYRGGEYVFQGMSGLGSTEESALLNLIQKVRERQQQCQNVTHLLYMLIDDREREAAK